MTVGGRNQAECCCMAIVWLIMLLYVTWPVAFALVFIWVLLQVREWH